MRHLISSFGILPFLIFSGCTNFEQDFINDELDLLVDNSENIDKLIQSFDKAFEVFLEADLALTEDELGDLFIQEAKGAGLKIIASKSYGPSSESMRGVSEYSDTFYLYSDLVSSPASFNTVEDIQQG